ncbi:MAG TPA: hypothetical protein VH641_21425 [Streptosporangiaceae bacterium]|jgi:hypothetical protein
MRVVLVFLGAVIFAAGIIFMLQGLGDIGGSTMTGKTFWAVLGPIIAVVGLLVAAIGLRRSRRHSV